MKLPVPPKHAPEYIHKLYAQLEKVLQRLPGTGGAGVAGNIPITAAEVAALVTPTDYTQLPGYRLRYGVRGDGSVETTALNNMFKVGHQGQALDFGSDVTIITAPVTLSTANANMPPRMVGSNVMFQAAPGSSGNFFTIENPHGHWDYGITVLGQFIFDAATICSCAFRLYGSQDSTYIGITGIRAVGGPNIWLDAASGHGIFYNTLISWLAGGSVANGADKDGGGVGGEGFRMISQGASNRIAANTMTGMRSQYNEGPGFDIDFMSGSIEGEAEINDGEGVNVDNSPALVLNLYTEHNHQGMSADGSTSDGTDDIAVQLSANSDRTCVLPNRTIGDVLGYDASGGNHVILPGQGGGITIWPTAIGFGGSTPPPNGWSFATDVDFTIRASGTTVFAYDVTNDRWRYYVEAQFSNGGIFLTSGTGTRTASAVLECQSTTQGFLPPKMTTTQRDAISSPAEGLVIYNTTTHKLNVRTASAWEAVTSA